MCKVILVLIILICSNVSAEIDSCGLNKQSIELAELIVNSNKQQRKNLICNPKLALAAYEKAKNLALADVVSHNIEHTTPNEHLKKFGIDLPFSYLVLGNQVEAISGGAITAKESFNNFMSSHSHKVHLLGENEFHQNQNNIGVGFYSDKTKNHEYYWVVYITSIKTQNEQLLQKPSFNTKLVISQSPQPVEKKKRFKGGNYYKKD